MSIVQVTVNGTNYTLTNEGAPAGAGPKVAGMQLVGLSKALAKKANDRGEYFGLDIVGSPSDGIDIIADAIIKDRIEVYL